MINLPGPLSDEILQLHLANIERDGYTIFENAIDPQFQDEISQEIERLERVRPGGDIPPALFTGQVTRRWFDLLNDGEVWQSVAIHPWVRQVHQHVLGDGYLLSTMGTAVIGPGETSQPLHVDDAVYGFARPHPTLVCNTMWAINEFTEENGATRIVPGSHKWDADPNLAEKYESIPALMPAGSICVFVGGLYHGAGANRSSGERIGLTINYCSGSMRQQENLMLGISPARMMTFPRELQDIIGFKMCKGAGHIFAQDPRHELARRFGQGAHEDPYLEKRNALHSERIAGP